MGRDHPDNLDKKSETLSRLGEKFPNLLKARANKPDNIDVICFFEEEDVNIAVEGLSSFKVC